MAISTINLTKAVSGILPIANGGTGTSLFTATYLIVAGGGGGGSYGGLSLIHISEPTRPY